MPSNKPEYPRIRVALASSAFLGELPASALDRLAAAAVLERHERASTIVTPGTSIDQLWFVLEGAMLVCWNGVHGPVPIAMLGPGSFYNSAAFVEGGNRDTAARVEPHTTLAVIDGVALRKVAADDPHVTRCVARLLLHRFQAALSFYADTVSMPLQNRIARRLVGQAMATRHDSPDGEIELSTSQDHLAKIVGSSRSKTNAELRLMEKQGLLRLGYRMIVLCDMRRLCEVAGARVPAF
jgi:CRP/FNR family transcriptional regulator, cyclic AMP receptor protein